MGTKEEGKKRRDKFLRIASELFSLQGYEDTSIQHIIDAVGVSKGAFYHHFKSKESLLQVLIEKYIERVIAEVAPVYNDHTLSAQDKIISAQALVNRLRGQSMEIIIGMHNLFNRPGNEMIAQRVMDQMLEKSHPLIASVIQQGIAEDLMHVDNINLTAEFLIINFSKIRSKMMSLWIKRHENSEYMKEIKENALFLQHMTESILGVASGSISIAAPYIEFYESLKKENKHGIRK